MLPTNSAQLDGEMRKRRWRTHAWARQHSARAGGRSCMSPLPQMLVKTAVTGAGVCYTDGVFRCSNILCVTCGPSMREEKRATVKQVLQAAYGEGCEVWFVTATMSHSLGDYLSDLYPIVTGAWSAAFSGKSAQHAAYIGQVRSIEFPFGFNGWHPHIHAALVFEKGTKRGVIRKFLGAAASRYRQSVRAAGGTVSSGRIGWLAMPCRSTTELAEYLSDAERLSFEVTRGDLKTGVHSLRASVSFEVMELLDIAANDVHDGNIDLAARLFVDRARAAKLYRAAERALRGKQLIVVSRKLTLRFPPPETAVEPPEAIVLEVSVLPPQWREWLRLGELGDFYSALRSLVVDGVVLPDWVKRGCRLHHPDEYIERAC